MKDGLRPTMMFKQSLRVQPQHHDRLSAVLTFWRWVQRYALILSQRIRSEMRKPNRSWRVG
jgi:hypothetical protein